MIVDSIENGEKYSALNRNFAAAFHYLQSTDFLNAAPGRHVLKGDELFAMISEYDTKPADGEKMEAHKKYIDIQYIISGKERMGIALLKDQKISTPYSEENDFMLFEDRPDYFIELKEGSFVIFYPTDLHLPTIQTAAPERVKKVVIKVSINTEF